MKKRTIAMIMAVLVAAAAQAGPVLAAEDAMEAIQEVVADAAEDPDAVTETADAADTVQEDTISGLYIVNYAQAEGNVNLNLIFASDLTAVSAQTDTVLYDFREDGTVIIYDRGEQSEGTYSADDTQLTINRGTEAHTYSYEFVDGLLILHDEGDSYALYHFVLETGVSLADYSEIEINEDAVKISDEDVDRFIQSLLQGQTRTEEVTEGVTEDGDIITISFEGILEGETEPFEGGSGENYTLQLGSGALIDNYEEQLTGQEIGSTVDVTVTFPEDYAGNEDLRGKQATFSTVIQSKTNVIVPELTDEWVQEYTAEYFPEKMDTVEQFRTYCRDYQSSNLLHNQVFQVLAGKLEDAEYRNTTMAQMLLNYASIHLSEAAATYGMDADTFAQQMGYSSAENYVQYEASSNIMSALIIDRVLQDLGIAYTESELEAKLAEDVKLSYGSTLTSEDYIAQSGTVGLWAYTNLQYKYNLATSALEDRVVLVPAADENDQEQTEAAE